MPLDISSAFLINSNRFTGVYGLVHSWMDSAIILYVSPSLRGSPGWGADLLASVNLVDGPVSSAHQSTPLLSSYSISLSSSLFDVFSLVVGCARWNSVAGFY